MIIYGRFTNVWGILVHWHTNSRAVLIQVFISLLGIIIYVCIIVCLGIRMQVYRNLVGLSFKGLIFYGV